MYKFQHVPENISTSRLCKYCPSELQHKLVPLVPTADVPDVFNHLVEIIPDTVPIDPLLSYFEKNRIAGLNRIAARYTPASWNQRQTTRRSIFLLDMLIQQSTTSFLPYSLKINSYRRGVQPLKHIVPTYHTNKNNVAAYLDFLAEL